MMEIVLEEKGVLKYATGDKPLAVGANDAENKTFGDTQVKVKQIIMSSLSMELGQQVVTKKSETEMWKYLENIYEGKTNAATRTNQEIILFNNLQATKCKPNWDVRQHLNNMFVMKSQLAALNADMRDRIFIDMLMRSLPSNHRYDRLRGMVETCASEVETPETLRNQIIRMNSYNRCDRELRVISSNTTQTQALHQVSKQKMSVKNVTSTASTSQIVPERSAAFATKKLDKQQGNCFKCYKSGHLEKDCPKKTSDSLGGSGKKQATYTRRSSTTADVKAESSPASDESEATVEAQQDITSDVSREDAPSKQSCEDFSVNVLTNAGSEDYFVSEWCFTNAANVHMASDRRYFTEYQTVYKNAECGRGFKKNFAAIPIGHETVQVVAQHGELDLIIALRDVFHVPDSNLLSHSQAEDQGYSIEYRGRSGGRKYDLWEGNNKLLEVGCDQHGLFTFTAQNAFLTESNADTRPLDADQAP
ncbi:hypothetical protein PF008_g583 [Phytophthora fragariae]|uniref:CCHC-type domain-containing protein n=1 Tax=Phytophthora fragariae TaxID=53985 RepID=A0A6G0SN69_9STRA|nr:hypothetical protein PF008_g583 [Phytophthora fragariae]